jgi:ATP-dependent exoDNAse (exonuclease V) beta subunit
VTPATDTPTLFDQEPASDGAARWSIGRDLSSTLFVEAGAGTGKTHALVGRILELVVTGTARIDQIAAITFTEAAAAELRDRIAEQLERLAMGTGGDEPAVPPGAGDRAERAERAHQALADVDAAAIGTLHSFARRILTEHPFEAGLPPSIEVFDEIRSTVAFDERWSAFVDELLDHPAHGQAVLRALVCGVRFDHLRAVADQFNENWDLVADLRWGARQAVPVDVGPVRDALDEAAAELVHCTDHTDKLALHIVEKLDGVRARLTAGGTELELLQLLVDEPKFNVGVGQKPNWGGRIDEVRGALARAESARRTLIADVGAAALEDLLVAITGLTVRAAADRRREGRLEFHDLLVGARDLLRSRPDVSAGLGEQYRYLLIDEFQDTDPIQVELAVRIVSDDAGAGAKPWMDLTFDPGRLFFVGDPKQSIYRFRRADIELFLSVRDRFAPAPLQLTANHRSVPGIIEWINALFQRLMGSGVDGMQPAYEDLVAVRPSQVSFGSRPPVVVIGGATDTSEPINTTREREAAELAQTIAQVRDEGWPVGEEGRPARLADITILVPTRTGLAIVERALEERSIPYRLESSSLVYASSEVRDLLTVLRAVDDPTDEVSIAAALRSALFGCGDDDLLEYRLHGGGWDYRAPPPAELSAEHPVVAGQRSLAALHKERWWQDVSGLIERVTEDRWLLGLALDQPRHREAWRRLRFVADQARHFVDAFGGDLRRYLAWADLQCAEEARVTEIVLPETDDDSVRIMTIHAAKGLEFPVVVLTGLNTGHQDRGGARVVWREGRAEVSVTKFVRTAGYAAAVEHDNELDRHERLRLLYVAATRAQDYLVVGLHHKAGSECPAALVETACVAFPELATLGAPARPPKMAAAQSPRNSTLADDLGRRESWERERAVRLEHALVPRVLAATTVATLARRRAEAAEGGQGEAASGDDGGLTADDPGVERAPWRRGRAGTAIGRAVHGVLQSVDLSSGAGVAALARSQAVAEGVPSRAVQIERLVRTALGSDVVVAAAAGRHWRELYVGVPVGDRVLEGFIDLLVEEGDGLAVVDYKTDQVSTDEELEDALARYRLQGAAYALAVERALGRPVKRCTFLFLSPRGALARDIAELGAAKEEVTRLLAAG